MLAQESSLSAEDVGGVRASFVTETQIPVGVSKGEIGTSGCSGWVARRER
jgi:hypothetical protein